MFSIALVSVEINTTLTNTCSYRFSVMRILNNLLITILLKIIIAGTSQINFFVYYYEFMNSKICSRNEWRLLTKMVPDLSKASFCQASFIQYFLALLVSIASFTRYGGCMSLKVQPQVVEICEQTRHINMSSILHKLFGDESTSGGYHGKVRVRIRR